MLFLLGLYGSLVGAKILIALLVARSRSFLQSRGYVMVNRLLGVALAVFALLFVRDGLGTVSALLGHSPSPDNHCSIAACSSS